MEVRAAYPNTAFRARPPPGALRRRHLTVSPLLRPVPTAIALKPVVVLEPQKEVVLSL